MLARRRLPFVLLAALVTVNPLAPADPPAHPGRGDWSGPGAFVPYDMPYLQLTTDRSFVVRWRSREPVVGAVQYGTAADALDQVVTEPQAATDHELRIEGLEPATMYWYVPLAGGEPLAIDGPCHAVTHPVPGTPVPTRVWVVADPQGYYDGAIHTRDAYLRVAGERRTDVFLSVGDDIRFFEIYGPVFRNTAFWPAMGNHDVADFGREGVEAYYAARTLPENAEAGGTASGTERYYSFDFGDVHFICLSSELASMAADGAQVAWLTEDLAATRAHWRIAYWHRPPYTRGRYDSDADGQMGVIRRNLLPVLEAGGVDLVLNGHCHIWQRSGLLDGHYGTSDTITDANRRDAGDGKPDGDGPYRKVPGPHGGTVYVIAGSSVLGSPEPLEHPAMISGSNALGTTVLDIEGDRLHVRYLNGRGDVVDEFAIEKPRASGGD